MEIALFIQNIQEERAEVRSKTMNIFWTRKSMIRFIGVEVCIFMTRLHFIYFPEINPTVKAPSSKRTKTGI